MRLVMALMLLGIALVAGAASVGLFVLEATSVAPLAAG